MRRLAHRLGYRFRLHRKDLPGKPDLVFPKHRKVMFVHGCFWHRHGNCPKASMPKTRIKFWKEKFDRNVKRDRYALEALRAEGWQTLIVWECETKDLEALESRLIEFLEA